MSVYVPILNERGERRYGRPGFPENASLCVAAIYPSYTSIVRRQCARKRGHGPGGLYCAQHAKMVTRE